MSGIECVERQVSKIGEMFKIKVPEHSVSGKGSPGHRDIIFGAENEPSLTRHRIFWHLKKWSWLGK